MLLIAPSVLLTAAISSLIDGYNGVLIDLSLVTLTALLWFGAVCRVPYRVTFDDAGVHFQARLRQIDIPWAEVSSIGRPAFFYETALRWERADGKPISMPRVYEREAEMLAEVERRAPQVNIWS